MKKLVISLSAVLLLSACSKEEDYFQLSGFEQPVVTGIQVRNHFGEYEGILGKPNIKIGNTSNHPNDEYSFMVYPNPCTEFGNLFIKVPHDTKIRIWIVKAVFQETPPRTLQVLNMNTVRVGSTPIINIESTDYLQENSNATSVGFRETLPLELKDYTPGFYRVYFQADDILLYDNILINNEEP